MISKIQFLSTIIVVWFCVYFIAEIQLLNKLGLNPNQYYADQVTQDCNMKDWGMLRTVFFVFWSIFVFPGLISALLA